MIEDPEGVALVEKLTATEKEVLVYMAKGLTCRECGVIMTRSMHTVSDWRKTIRLKLRVSTAEEASVLATKAGLV